MARHSTPPRSGTGGLLIPVSGVDDAEGRVSEQVGEGRIAGKGRDGTPKRDMIRDEMILRKHTESSSLEPNVTHEVLTRKMCACVHTVRCSVSE